MTEVLENQTNKDGFIQGPTLSARNYPKKRLLARNLKQQGERGEIGNPLNALIITLYFLNEIKSTHTTPSIFKPQNNYNSQTP